MQRGPGEANAVNGAEPAEDLPKCRSGPGPA